MNKRYATASKISMSRSARVSGIDVTRVFVMLRHLVSLVKIEHTLFAMPLALTGAVLAARGLPGWKALVLLALAFTAARTAAMAFNRIVDRRLDALNPRTATREIPAGAVSVSSAATLVVLSSAVFMLAAWGLNDVCLTYSPLVLFLLLGYSFTKRFTWLCHIFLGLCLGMAPVAGWLAVRPVFDWAPLILGAGVVFWVAGFDIIYACQDTDFDRKANLHSLPAWLGAAPALWLAAGAHVIAFGLFLLTGVVAGLGWLFYPFSLLTAGLLIWEHRLVKPSDLRRLDLAFFKVNSLVSLSLLMSVASGV